MNREYLIIVDSLVVARITCTYRQACKELVRFRDIYLAERVELAQVVVDGEEL